MTKAWMVRAEKGGRLFDAFKDNSIVAIGWPDLGNLSSAKSRKAIYDIVETARPSAKPQWIAMSTGQLHRFVNEMNTGDTIVTYDPSRRVYLYGEITGDYRYDPSIDPNDPHIRSVKWAGEISRDLLSVASRNSLGAYATLFLLTRDIVDDLNRALQGSEAKKPTSPSAVETEIAEEDVFLTMQARALEFIKDRVNSLDWEEMQELVAGLLRSLGYKTRVSDVGPDRGKDIIASPDGFGFESPRIVVEVKHRKGAMGAPDIRSFLGGRHPQDKGLYVSTGGFTKEARYEAERANIPLALMDIDELVQSVIEQFEKLDLETQQLLPLKRIYVPAWG